MKNSTIILILLFISNVVNAQTEDSKETAQLSILLPKRHKISLNYGEILVQRIGVAYEYRLHNDKVALKVPFSLSYENNDRNFNDPFWQAGLDLLYYPLGTRKVSYFTGIGTRFGEERIRPQYSILSQPDEFTNRSYGGAYIQNGIVFNMTDQFSSFFMIGLGSKAFRFEDIGDPHIIGELGASIKF